MANNISEAMSGIADGISEDFLTCPVCTNAYDTPKILPCMHSFCQGCLKESLSQSNITNGQSFLCPICHNQCYVPKRGVVAFPSNIFVETLFEFANRKASPTKAKEPPKPLCEGCDDGIPATKKCVECDDWLCAECVMMHKKVKLTREHHLADIEDLQKGAYDDLLKDTFEPLLCSKHEEPLKLYCTETSCQTPICTICKTTLGHDGHRAIEIEEQGRYDVENIHFMTGNVQNNINAIMKKIEQVKFEDKVTSTSRKDIHKAINARMEEVVDKVVKQIGAYAEGLHEEVETLAKTHKQELADQMDQSKFQLEGMKAVMTFAANLVNFGRSEEIVAMARQLMLRLEDFQQPPFMNVPGWRHPKIRPPNELTNEYISQLFGSITFQGELIRCVLVRSFNTRLSDDEKACSLSDIDVTEENDLMIVDKDNKRIKVFDAEGELLFTTDNSQFKAPNRVTLFKSNGNALVKDEKKLKVLTQEGTVSGNFAPNLKQPVGLCQTSLGRIMITDWTSGNVHCFDEDGMEDFSFACQSEAPAYVASTPDGNIIAVSDWKHNIVKVFNSQGTLLYQYGTDGELNHPYGVCMDHHGHLLIADNWNNRIHLVGTDGKLIQYLLTKDEGLQWPQALAISKEGHLVVAEIQGNVKIYQYLA